MDFLLIATIAAILLAIKDLVFGSNSKLLVVIVFAPPLLKWIGWDVLTYQNWIEVWFPMYAVVVIALIKFAFTFDKEPIE